MEIFTVDDFYVVLERYHRHWARLEEWNMTWSIYARLEIPTFREAMKFQDVFLRLQDLVKTRNDGWQKKIDRMPGGRAMDRRLWAALAKAGLSMEEIQRFQTFGVIKAEDLCRLDLSDNRTLSFLEFAELKKLKRLKAVASLFSEKLGLHIATLPPLLPPCKDCVDFRRTKCPMCPKYRSNSPALERKAMDNETIITGQNEEIRALKTTITGKDEEIRALKEELNRVTIDRDTTITGKDEEIHALKEEVNRLTTEGGTTKKELDRVTMERDSLKESRKCTICFEEEADTFLLPCGHLHICQGCSQDNAAHQLDSGSAVACPICRQDVISAHRAYFG